jgi:hypothetical protein
LEGKSWIKVLEAHLPYESAQETRWFESGWNITRYENERSDFNTTVEEKTEEAVAEVKEAEAEEEVEYITDKNGTVFDPELHQVTKAGKPKMTFGNYTKIKK